MPTLAMCFASLLCFRSGSTLLVLLSACIGTARVAADYYFTLRSLFDALAWPAFMTVLGCHALIEIYLFQVSRNLPGS